MDEAGTRLVLSQVAEDFAVGLRTTPKNVTIRFHEAVRATPSILLVSQGNLLGAVVLLGKDRHPFSADAVRLEHIGIVYSDSGPFGSVALDFRRRT